MKTPWEFGETDAELIASGEGTPNLPSRSGAEVGVNVAEIAERGKEKLAASGLALGRRCDDCAFTKGTRPNQSTATLADAVKCVVESVPFYCHKGDLPGTRLCGGYTDALAHPALREG